MDFGHRITYVTPKLDIPTANMFIYAYRATHSSYQATRGRIWRDAKLKLNC